MFEVNGRLFLKPKGAAHPEHGESKLKKICQFIRIMKRAIAEQN